MEQSAILLENNSLIPPCKAELDTLSIESELHNKPLSLSKQTLLDLFQLTKPRLSSLVLFTMSAGMVLSQKTLFLPKSLLAVLATFGIVGASNSFNMYFDRNMDSLMNRTKQRPIPSKRLSPKIAVYFGLCLLLISIPVLYLTSNGLTTGLGVLASFLYVCVYTPLKPRTPYAVYVGAIPGALPMLMGYTAATNQIDAFGLSLFSILLFWQIPHFLAISLNLEQDYKQASVQVYSVAFGETTTRKHLILFSFLLALITLSPILFSSAGLFYVLIASSLGLFYGIASLICLNKTKRMDRPYFLGTLIHLPILLTALILDIFEVF